MTITQFLNVSGSKNDQQVRELKRENVPEGCDAIAMSDEKDDDPKKISQLENYSMSQNDSL